MSADTRLGMYNPGDLRVSEGITIAPAKKVTLFPIPIAGVLLEIGWLPKISRWPTASPTDEEATLAETTLPS